MESIFEMELKVTNCSTQLQLSCLQIRKINPRFSCVSDVSAVAYSFSGYPSNLSNLYPNVQAPGRCEEIVKLTSINDVHLNLTYVFSLDIFWPFSLLEN